MAIAAIPLSNYGLTGWVDPAKIHTGDLIKAENTDLSYGHMIQKEGGTIKVNAVAISGSPSIVAGFDYFPVPSTQRRVIATSDGRLFKDDMSGTFATTLKTGLGADKIVQMIEGGAEVSGNNKKLFICNGNDPVQILSGDAATTVNIGANKPADWTATNQPTFLFKFRNTLAGGGNVNDPYRVYISSATDQEDFRAISGGLSLSIFPGEGQRLVAGITALGKGYLWKYPNGIYFIDDDDNSSTNWVIKRLTGEYGAAPTPHSVVQIDQGTIAFLSSAGDVILMQETPGQLTGVEFVNLTKTLNLRTFMKANFDLARLDKSQLRWYPDKLQLHVLLSSINSGKEDRRLILDFADEKTRVHVSTKDTNESIWMELDAATRVERPIIGDNIGFVRKIDQSSRTLEGATAYTMSLETVASDFSDVNPAYSVKKLFYRLHLEYEISGNADVAIQVLVDGHDKGTVTFNQAAGGSVLPFQLDQFLSGNEIRRRSRDIAGEGYYVALRIIETTTNNPRLARVWVEFEPLEMAR